MRTQSNSSPYTHKTPIYFPLHSNTASAQAGAPQTVTRTGANKRRGDWGVEKNLRNKQHKATQLYPPLHLPAHTHLPMPYLSACAPLNTATNTRVCDFVPRRCSFPSDPPRFSLLALPLPSSTACFAESRYSFPSAGACVRVCMCVCVSVCESECVECAGDGTSEPRRGCLCVQLSNPEHPPIPARLPLRLRPTEARHWSAGTSIPGCQCRTVLSAPPASLLISLSPSTPLFLC